LLSPLLSLSPFVIAIVVVVVVVAVVIGPFRSPVAGNAPRANSVPQSNHRTVRLDRFLLLQLNPVPTQQTHFFRAHSFHSVSS
jgi:hypothetical protein